MRMYIHTCKATYEHLKLRLISVNAEKQNRYRWRPWRSDGIQVWRRERRRPTDPNPVWIPTNPMTLCRFGSPSIPFAFAFAFPSPAPRSHTTRTVLGSAFEHLLGDMPGPRIATSPNMNPENPISRQLARIRTVDLRGDGDARCCAWKNLGEEGIVAKENKKKKKKNPRLEEV